MFKFIKNVSKAAFTYSDKIAEEVTNFSITEYARAQCAYPNAEPPTKRRKSWKFKN